MPVLTYRVEYEIEMTKILAKDQSGSRCGSPSNLALCIEESLNQKINCSLGMMARVYDNRTVCSRMQSSVDASKFDIINDSKILSSSLKYNIVFC